jgi:tRNA A37 threonylcarbamoyladenosine biosynthesis protein TsaE
MKFVSHSVSETEDFAKKYVAALLAARKHTESAKAFVLGLYGNLGSGKTAFTQAVAAALGVRDSVTSPTFVIEKIYPLTHSLSTLDSQGFAQSFPPSAFTPAYTQASTQSSSHNSAVFTHLIHMDAYRLESSDEMKHLGWDEIASNPHNLIIIEWPERISDLLPADHSRLKFTFIDETTRKIESPEVIQ